MSNFFSAIAKELNTPEKVQAYLRKLKYNDEKGGETLRSALSTAKAKKAHCLEAALLAAAILEKHGFPPMVMSLESQDNLDHVIYVYRSKGRWGSIARSRDDGLHGRKAQFRSLRDLAYSYYEPYIDKTGCITAYQLANLDDSKVDWRNSRAHVWKVEQFLIDLKHLPIVFNKARYQKIHKNYLSGVMAKKQNSWL